MTFSQKLKIKTLSFLGIDDIHSRQDEILKNQKDLEDRITFLETKVVEISRAVATVALIQANVVREMGDIVTEKEKKRTKATYLRKSTDDFTN